MNQDLVRADPAYRKKVIFVYVIFAAVGAAIIGWGIPWLGKHLQSLDPKEALQFMKLILIAVFLGVLPLAFYLLRFGRKVIQAEQFPPPGVKVIRDTAVLVGGKAKLRGRAIVALSLILVLLSLLGAFYMPYLLDKVATRSSEAVGRTQ